MSDPLHRLPDSVTVPLADLRTVVIEMEKLQARLSEEEMLIEVAVIDDLIGHMLRWIWPLLGDLDG